ncbi:hypothetical protein GCM10009560_58440 [Nonomuraea longicatena]|uniref:Cell envelope-related transcriptional attenuator domain-containing protein n=1 Tax=Nonomuraea longicatena TaxID=83682 RepID=A0ABP4B4P4_9ACTN
MILLSALGLFLANGSRLGALVSSGMLTTVNTAAWVGAGVWFALIISSYIALRPNQLTRPGQIVTGILAGVMCVAVAAPFGWAADTSLTTKKAIDGIFKEDPAEPGAVPIKEDDPWNGKDRVNFLLLGGDGAGNREGIRTDSMNVASIHIPTGNTVLFSLPRNLQHVRFPPNSPMAKAFPHGFQAELPNGGLLNELWQFANDNPQVAGGKNRGGRVLMDAIGHTLGLKIDHYALINMYGFAYLVDAIGGLRIRVDHDVPWGGLYGTAGTIKAGERLLTGEQALWYGRSRVNSDDFSRMGRQRCVIGAFTKQATPQKVLTNFTKIANAARRMASTNIPRALVEHVVDLALKVKDAKITSMQFVPPTYWPGRPDWPRIRRAAQKALTDSLKPSRKTLTAKASGAPSGGTPSASGPPSGGTPSATPSRTRVNPTQTPTANDNKSAKSLDELCGL